MVGTIIFFGVLLWWCLIFAKLEVETEGQDGWAVKLPTTRFHWDGQKLTRRGFDSAQWMEVDHTTLKGKILVKYIGVLGGRDFTTYHRMVDLIQLTTGHLVAWCAFQGLVSWYVIELRAFAFLVLCWSLEDTLWFFWNPYFGPKKYKPEYIPWHAQDWFYFAPKGMIMLFGQGILLYGVSIGLPYLISWLKVVF